MWRQEFNEKAGQLAGRYFDEHNIIPIIREHAVADGEQRDEEIVGYILNSTMTPIASDTFIIHSPSGRTLTVIDNSVKIEEKQLDTEEIMKMAAFLSHRNIPGERQYSTKDTAIATCLVFWDIIPSQIKEGFEHSFEYHGFSSKELDDLLIHTQAQHFEGIINIATEYSSMFNIKSLYSLGLAPGSAQS